MRIKHDNGCLWWKDRHSCSCGYLEEEVRNETKSLTQSCCQVIPGTFIMCSEDVGEQKQYCSNYCLNKSKGENDEH